MTGEDLDLLLFEERGTYRDARKTEAIRVRYGISLARYEQRLLALVQEPEAVRRFPQLVYRLIAQQEKARNRRDRRAHHSGMVF